MTVSQVKTHIRRSRYLDDLMLLVNDHDRLERENAELQNWQHVAKILQVTVDELQQALETATRAGVAEQVEASDAS